MSTPNVPPAFNNYELFIFDLDGTLYDQKKLRKKLLIQLIIKLLRRKISFTDLKIINSFRRQRELHKGYISESVEKDQYTWVENELQISAVQAKNIIRKWMFQFPLPYLIACRYSGVKEFFRELRRSGKLIAIYSDFPVVEKMHALEMEADLHLCSTDSAVNQLKPSARGLEFICEEYKIPVEKAIFIGDRIDTDGKSAEMANMDFILVDVQQARKAKFYPELIKRLSN